MIALAAAEAGPGAWLPSGPLVSGTNLGAHGNCMLRNGGGVTAISIGEWSYGLAITFEWHVIFWASNSVTFGAECKAI